MDKVVNLKFNIAENDKSIGTSFIDLKDTVIENQNDLALMCDVFRNPKYEIFRIFYLNGNKIVGQEWMTDKIPNQVKVFSKNSYHSNSITRNIEQMKKRMLRLNADSYYLAHNHSSSSSEPSNQDMRITKVFTDNVDGFKGHIVLGSTNKYSFINLDQDGNLFKTLCEEITNSEYRKFKNKSIYDVVINSRKDLVAFLKSMERNKDYSTVVLTGSKSDIRMVLDIPNKMFNQELTNLNGYFKNLARECGAIRVFVGTEDENVYQKLEEHNAYGTIKDYIYLIPGENEITYKANSTLIDTDLFDTSYRELINMFSQNDEDYLLDNKSIENDKLTVLYKKVGENPIVIQIDDTLEAKQNLVGGLIELVPYNEGLLVCNEEGKLMNMAPNVIFDFDYIAGDFFIVGDDYKNAGFKSLTSKEIKEFIKDLEPRSIKYDLSNKEKNFSKDKNIER